MMAFITPIKASGSAGDRVGAHEPLRPALDVLPAILGEAEQVGGQPASGAGRRGHGRPRAGRRRATASSSSSMRDCRNGSCLLHGPWGEPPVDEAALLRGAQGRRGRSCSSPPSRVGPVGAPARRTRSLRRSTSIRSAWRVTAHRPFGSSRYTGASRRAQVKNSCTRSRSTHQAGSSRSAFIAGTYRQRASMSITIPMPTTRVSAMLRVFHATSAATTPARKRGCHRSS